MTLTLDAAARSKYTGLFEQACARAGGVTKLDKPNAGLHKSGLATDVLLKIWALVDIDQDDHLSLPEYLMCCVIIAHCVRTKEHPPASIPSKLLQSASASSTSTPCLPQSSRPVEHVVHKAGGVGTVHLDTATSCSDAQASGEPRHVTPLPPKLRVTT